MVVVLLRSLKACFLPNIQLANQKVSMRGVQVKTDRANHARQTSGQHGRAERRRASVG
jgi:hypothetical protein